jgi:hypothetical protein
VVAQRNLLRNTVRRAAPHLQVTPVRVLTTDDEVDGEAAQVLGISPFDLKTVG